MNDLKYVLMTEDGVKEDNSHNMELLSVQYRLVVKNGLQAR